MTHILTVHDIGRAGDPAATVTTRHTGADVAYGALVATYGAERLRGGATAGTVGSLNGSTFQASKTRRIDTA